MIVVYHDIGGAHSAAVAANIHTGNLPSDTVPERSAVLSLPTFDNIEKKDWGRFIHIGKDEFGADVYTLSRQRAPEIVIPAITDLYNILNNTERNEGLYVVDTSATVNLLMKIGGFLSRRLGLVGVGRPIVTYGTLQAYKDIADVVIKAKGKMRENTGKK